MDTSFLAEFDPRYTTNGTVNPADDTVLVKAFDEVKKRERLVETRGEIETMLINKLAKDGNPAQISRTVMIPTEKEKNDIFNRTNPLIVHTHVTKRNKNYHYIHGKPYDLRSFMKNHPGGEGILKMTQGLVDSTPLFESYHAFANRPMIMKQLEGYRVIDSEEDEKEHENDHGMYSFEENGFYKTLTRRVRSYYDKEGVNTDKKSLTSVTKANGAWFAKVLAQFSLAVAFFSLAFFNKSLPLPVSIICAMLAGSFQIQWGFTAMHDASHFAIAPRNHWSNEIICRVWCALSWWVCRIWMLHHAVLHHAFTGASNLDPDLYHMMPFVRKHPDVPRSLTARFARKLGEWFGMAGYGIAAVILYAIAPGMWLGQVIVYGLFSFGVGHMKDMWGMEFPKHDAYAPKWYEYALMGLHLVAHLYRFNIFVSYAFIVALNISYCMCIVADHDTAEASLTNHVDVDSSLPPIPEVAVTSSQDSAQPENEPIDGNNAEDLANQYNSNYGKVDWGEAQVRNSSNFCNHWASDIFAFLHGSINYQIEHHLFPGMNHIHLPKIAPIVRQTCEEFGIPYTAYPSLTSAWYSFLVTMRSCMSEETLKKDE